MSRYFVVPAPGHYGDRARVMSSHGSIARAQSAAGHGYVVRVGDKRRGDEWIRAYEEIYPIAGGESVPLDETCPDCEGTGHEVGGSEECACDEAAGETCCTRCGGTGRCRALLATADR